LAFYGPDFRLNPEFGKISGSLYHHMATNFNRVIKGYLEIFGGTLHGPVQVDERSHCEGGRPFWTTRSLPTKNEISIKLKWNSRSRKISAVRRLWRFHISMAYGHRMEVMRKIFNLLVRVQLPNPG
jgi:hypothetical protein